MKLICTDKLHTCCTLRLAAEIKELNPLPAALPLRLLTTIKEVIVSNQSIPLLFCKPEVTK